jgi:ABC-type antimicrobial peptide transport system permease subunit
MGNLIIFQRLQNRVHSSELSLWENLFGEGHGDLNLATNEIKRAVVSFVLINSMTGIRSALVLTYIATLLADTLHLSSLLRFLNSPHYVVNVGVIFHIMKSVVPSHLLDLE